MGIMISSFTRAGFVDRAMLPYTESMFCMLVSFCILAVSFTFPAMTTIVLSILSAALYVLPIIDLSTFPDVLVCANADPIEKTNSITNREIINFNFIIYPPILARQLSQLNNILN